MNAWLKGFRLLILLALLAATLASVGLTLAFRPHKGFAGGSARLEIPRGMSTPRIFGLLAERGVVRNRWLALTYYRLFRRGDPLKAGEYEFAGAKTIDEVVDMLVRGDVVRHVVVVPEGLTAKETLELFWKQGISTEEGFRRAVSETDVLSRYPEGAGDLEGFLFPDTYLVTRSTTAREVIALMTASFRRHFTAAMRARAARLGLTVRDAVTLASLVERETSLPRERPVVAAVFLNRMRRGMRLQCDPTVIYSLQRDGKWTGNLQRSELDYDSLYNTYLYSGLPPGPIGNPGAASLRAAVNPAAVDYLYFVSRNDGSHAFSRTYDEHLRLVQIYQKGSNHGGPGAAAR